MSIKKHLLLHLFYHIFDIYGRKYNANVNLRQTKELGG